MSAVRRPPLAGMRSPGRLLLISAAILAVAVIAAIASGGGGSLELRAPLPGIGRPAKARDPFAYVSSRESDFVARAIAGEGHVLCESARSQTPLRR